MEKESQEKRGRKRSLFMFASGRKSVSDVIFAIFKFLIADMMFALNAYSSGFFGSQLPFYSRNTAGHAGRIHMRSVVEQPILGDGFRVKSAFSL
jgi:hypothetical protein